MTDLAAFYEQPGVTGPNPPAALQRIIPVTDADLASVVTGETLEGAQWPPLEVWNRIRWLTQLRDAYDGSQHGDGPRVAWCQEAVTRIAQFLTSTDVTAGEQDLTGIAYDAVAHMAIYGGAILWPDPANTEQPIEVIDPREWVPTSTGWIYLNPIAGDNGVITTAHVVEYVAASSTAGTVYTTLTAFSASNTGYVLGTVGQPLEQLAAPYTAPPAFVVRNGLTRGNWGTSIIEPGVTWQHAAAVRWRSLQAALLQGETPIPGVRMHNSDIDQLRARLDDGDDGFGSADDTDVRTAVKLRYGPAAELLTDEIASVEFAQYDPPTDQALMVIEQMRKQFDDQLGVTSQPDGAQSGRALRWANLALYQQTLSIQSQLKDTLEGAVGAPVEWAHPFDEELTGEVVDDEPAAGPAEPAAEPEDG